MSSDLETILVRRVIYRARVALTRQELEQGTDLTCLNSCDRYFSRLLDGAERDHQHIQEIVKGCKFKLFQKPL